MDGNWVILGIGNLLMGDDGVGIHAVRELARQPIAGVEVVDAGTDYLSALPFLENAQRVLVLDAVRGRNAPGSIYRLAEQELSPRPDGSAAHVTSILEARRLLSPGAAWPEITVLGVEPAVVDYGMDLSAPVAAALPELVALALEIITSWQNRPSSNATLQVAS